MPKLIGSLRPISGRKFLKSLRCWDHAVILRESSLLRTSICTRFQLTSLRPFLLFSVRWRNLAQPSMPRNSLTHLTVFTM